jgi:prepilin-type N-terminal cleavage/methylation domain-containing protein
MKKQVKLHDIHGFSLVELSIVLVILGLLVGGVLTGKSLIRAAELRAVTTEFASYQAAVQTFKDKYQAFPGDMTNATRFWGDNNTYCADGTIPNGNPGTCNGNGDGLISTVGTVATAAEMFMFWNQLALSGMLTGTYDGIVGSTNWGKTATNVPVSKSASNSWWAIWTADYRGGSNWAHFAYDHKNVLEVSSTNIEVLKSEEAWNIDKKIDDGLPARGNVHAITWNDRCSAADDGSSAWNDFNASYRVTNTSLQCGLLFVNW